MKNKFIYVLIILLLAPIVLTSCDSTTGEQPEEDKSAFLVTYSDNDIKGTITHLTDAYNEVKAATDSATAETASVTREEITTLEANLDRLDDELTKAVENNRISQDVKKSYDQSIEDLRTEVNSLNQTLTDKGL